jgi:hypothetical protein
LKLSRAGWNNVIIFSAMAIILIANLTTKHLFNEQGSSQSQQDIYVIGKDAVILTLSINNQLTVKRDGLSWQSNMPGIKTQTIDQMMQSWHSLQADIPAQEPQMQGLTPVQVNIVVAGQTKTIELMLYPTKQALYIYQHFQKQWYVAPEALYRQLVPITI